ncbi:MAG: PspC domain-containing protein [Limnohabitans sp.]|nr:PspC domain-containing protein [Limnohabitans sp.]
MNKTVSMNLGGFFFHIDEDAYQKLNRYFEAIKASLSPEGREEIMNDIESRVAELFSEKITNSQQVLSIKDIDDVIAVMGQPEDYKIEDENKSGSNFNYSETIRTKKLYRDSDSKIVAGVCSGLGHYFGVDAVWIRVALVLLVFAGFGTGILAYIILWAVTPEALTTSEKLEMKGEPINISNIEKKVREEFEYVSEKFKNQDFGKINESVKENMNKFNESFRSTAQKTSGGLGDAIVAIAKAFAKLIGAFMLFIGSIVIIGMLITLFTMGSTKYVHVPWLDYYNTFNYTGVSLWMISLLFFFAISIPFFFLLLLGLKILFSNIQSIGAIAKYTLLAVWLMSIIGLITIGVKTSAEVAFDNNVMKKTTLALSPSDTLTLKFVNNELYSKDVNDRENFRLVQDSTGHTFMYSNEVNFEIMPTDSKEAYVQIEKSANGSSLSDARKRASTIEYKFRREGNTLIFDNYLLMDAKDKFRDQEVNIYLYLPKGTLIKPDSSLRYFDDTDGDYFTFYPESNDYVYKVGEHKIKCQNCPSNIEDEDEDEDWDDENDYNDKNTSVIINEDGIKIKKDTTVTKSKEIKELKINEDGIIIKTK